MNDAIKEFINTIISIATSALSGNIPLVGAAAVSLLEQLIEQAQNLIDGDGSLTEEEKAKLKAVLSSVVLKSTNDYLAAQGLTREQVDQFIADLKSGG